MMNRWLVLTFSLLLSIQFAKAIDRTDSIPFTKITVYTTADSSNLRLTLTDTLGFHFFGQPLESEPCIFVDPSKTFQTFVGIGGALTDASAEVYFKLSKATRKQFMQDYYDPQKGIGYTLGRTNISSCDFSSESYSYVQDNDTTLKTFTVAHDKKYRIPFIKDAIVAAGGQLTLFASPWSPPAWMKDNHDVLHGGKLLPSCYQAWADYYVRFVNAYKKEGIPIWGLTIQNEPMAIQTWESCIYTADEERNFIKYFLGKTLWSAGMDSIHLIAWDHNRDLMYQRASDVLDDTCAAKYVWGIGYHWYEHFNGSMIYDNVKRVAEAYPKTHLLFTEGCAESFDSSKLNSWKFGETYARSMIEDFNNGTVGFTDWNVLLNEKGGPNHVGNYCFSPIMANTKTGKLTYLNSYYYIGHFSKFIRPSAKRIISSSTRGQLLTTAFINPDGKIAVIVMNQSDLKFTYDLWIGGQASLIVSLPHSIETLVVE